MNTSKEDERPDDLGQSPEREPIDSVEIGGTIVRHSPDGEWPRVHRGPDSETIQSGPGHRGFI